MICMKEGNEVRLEEFKVVYKLEGSLDLVSKYFMANQTADAKKMFSFVCQKNDLVSTVHHIEKWNRWNSKWEIQEEENN
jgi:hypothetical protein